MTGVRVEAKGLKISKKINFFQQNPRFIMLIFILLTKITLVFSKLIVSDFKQCPRLSPRSNPPSSIRDLRPDDISVFPFSYLFRS
jgi:hypothetical protein